MKVQSKFFNYFVACAATLSLATFAACGGDEGKDDPQPEGLILTATPTSIVAGEGNVTFRVTEGGKEVTSSAVITNTTDGTTVENATWTTATKGSYKFRATYDGKTSNEVIVTASGADEKTFYRNVLLVKFTGKACAPCRAAQIVYEDLEAKYKDHFVVVAAHMSIPSYDNLHGEAASELSQAMGNIRSVPTWFYNLEQGKAVQNNTRISMIQQINRAENTFPAVCGIKAVSTLDGANAQIKATVKFMQAGNYKIACVLTEDGIASSQTTDLWTSYSDVLRSAQTDMLGVPVAPAVTGEEEREFTFDAKIASGWKAENCHLVVYVFKEEGSEGYVVNNVIKCALDGAVDYKYN